MHQQQAPSAELTQSSQDCGQQSQASSQSQKVTQWPWQDVHAQEPRWQRLMGICVRV